MAVTTAALSGSIKDLGLEIPDHYLARVVLVVEANTPGSLLRDTSGNTLLAGAKRVTVDKTTGTFSQTLVTTNSADIQPADDRLYKATLIYPSGKPGAKNELVESGWFPFTADASLADAWQGIEVTAVSTALYESISMSVASAEASAVAAAAGAQSSAASATLAQTLVTSDLGTTDGQTRALIEDPNSQVSGALAAMIAAEVPDASTTVKGRVELATNAEAITGTDTVRALTPAGAKATYVAKGAHFWNVRDYGAVGDGVTVDTQAFRDAASAAGTGTVIVPAGTGAYVLDASVSYPCTFLFMPGATFTNGGYITGAQVALEPRDYDALMGCGYFNVWLDGNTFSTPASNSFVATLWRVLYDGTSGTFAIDQAGGPLSIGAGNGLRWNQTVAGTGSTYRMIEFRVEDASIFNGDKATLSLIAQTEVDPTACSVEVVQAFGTGGSPSADVVVGTGSFTATATSQRFQWTFDVPSTSAKTFGSAMNDSLKVRVKVPNNSTFNVVFKQVRLERGRVRSNFSQIPLSMQHAYIARYIQYAVVSLGAVATAASQYTYCPIPFNGEMRAAPTITWSTVAGAATNNVSVTIAATHIQKYGASAYIASTAAGAFNSSGQQAKLDARL